PIKFDESGNFNTPQNWPVPVKSGFHARQLLSVEEQGAERAGVGGVGEGSRVSSNLKKDSFWMDDLVNNYKKEHMDKILGVLRDTSSISLQRMLRRKLKEELGIRVPMPIPRTRRIAYTRDWVTFAFFNNHIDPIPQKLKFDVPSPPPNVKPPTKDHACGQSSHVDKQQNETESLRVSQDLEQWIAREKINKEAIKVKVETKRDSPTVLINKRKRIAIPPKYAHRRPTKATGVAVYKEKEKKLFQFLDTIGRKNDTIYIISLNQDHILLPSMVKNSLLPTKMSLVFPTAPPNDTFANNPDYQTLIQIDCDVTATDYIQVKRDLLPNNHN
uniref:Uncharacterized protein n=1 Tax=Ciona savignyi TaxID=51511 RepID=H2YS80_CIOSA